MVKCMSNIKSRLLCIIASALAVGLSGTASAQQTGDFPGFKGTNSKTGRVVGPDTPTPLGPGLGYLTWFAPRGFNGRSTQIDDTDFDYVPTATYDGNPNGISEALPNLAGWSQPDNIFDVAQPFIRPYNFVKQPAFGLRNPVFHLTSTVASSPTTDPNNPKGPQDGWTRAWNYRFFGTGSTSTAPAGAYALYVHLPVGGTTVGGIRQFPQRYYVYTITSGTHQWTDVVDTYLAGTGWVRLGGGGAATSAAYAYNGTDPLVVTLYNTVPRLRHIVAGSNDDSLYGGNGSTVSSPEIGRLVYADAAKAIPVSGYAVASPIAARTNPADSTTDTVYQARNEYSTSLSNTGKTVSQGTLTAYHSSNADATNRGKALWSYSPIQQTSATTTVDNTSFTSVQPGWLVDATLAHYVGTDCLKIPASATQTAIAGLDFTGADGTYGVYVYSPGDQPGVPISFSKSQRFWISEQGTFYPYDVDMSVAGWHQVGTRRFQHSNAISPLRVFASDFTNSNQDIVDGRFNYVDGIRFVSDANLEIKSTPVYADALVAPEGGGAPVAKKVVIVGDESGRLHCVDAVGNGDGTTTEYWSYPSTPDPNNPAWTDPNQVAGLDGVGGVAAMPGSFNLSSALVKTITVGGVSKTELFVGASNGRVYCIDVTGRGDYSAANHLPGTTTRVWTYPATYPSTKPIANSPLGGFDASIVYGELNDDATQPLIYAPTTQGRMYCLNAIGTSDLTTTVQWQFPAANKQVLGAISSTPLVEFGNIYFGTQIAYDFPAAGDAFVYGRGAFYSLNKNTGVLQNWGTLGAGGEAFEDFVASPASAPYTLVGDLVTPGGLIFVHNSNRFVYALDSSDLHVVWSTDELGSQSVGSLTFTTMDVYDVNGATGNVTPVVQLPSQDGRFTAFFATPASTNRFGTRRAWQYNPQGEVTASLAVANGFLYGADLDGYVYAFSSVKGTFLPDEFVPGTDFVVENNPLGDVWRKAKIKLINQDAYRKLVDDATATAAQRSYALVSGNGSNTNRNPAAFEWGETLYAVVYDLPFLDYTRDGTVIAPPQVNISINVNGRAIRQFSVEGRQLTAGDAKAYRDVLPVYNMADRNSYIPSGPLLSNYFGTDADPVNDLGFDTVDPMVPADFATKGNLNYIPMDGYAIVAFPIQGAGAQALPPGDANITFTVQSGALATASGQVQTFAPNPTSTFGRVPFKIANPLGISTKLDSNGIPVDNKSFGYTTNPSSPEALAQGSPNLGGGKNGSHLQTSAGVSTHGRSSSTSFWVFDRSFMSLLRPNDSTTKDPQGLDQVRIDRRDLAWQGGGATVRKPFDPVLYPNFEDYPVNFPNTSKDYPNISREAVTMTKDPNGIAENPIFGGVTLKAPMVSAGGTLRALQDGDQPADRIIRPTEVRVGLDVPKYQPANNMVNDLGVVSPDLFYDSANDVLDQGYIGRLSVFVDADGTGTLSATNRKAFRLLRLSTAVSFDEKLVVTTPQIDAGSLPGGSGLTRAGQTPSGQVNFNGPASLVLNPSFNPWSPNYATQFNSFDVLNEGNVNLLNVRLAHADARTSVAGPGDITPWYWSSPSSDSLAWLDGTLDLWSSLDEKFHPTPGTNIIIQKSRVGDVLGQRLNVNPKRRANENLGVTGLIPGTTDPDVLNQTRDGSGNLVFAPDSPKVGLTIPIGFPTGTYSAVMRVIEKQDSRLSDFWERINNNEIETFSDPTFTLTFSSRETRLTNRNTKNAGTMINNDLDPNWPNNPALGYAQGAGPANTAFAYQHMQPAAMRDAFGGLVVAWTSDRPVNPTLRGGEASIAPLGANTTGQYRINLATLATGATMGQNSFGTPVTPTAQPSPLRDLDFWKPASNSSWFNHALQGYPNLSADTVFGGTTVPGTDSYGGAAFPVAGLKNPWLPTETYNTGYMAFVGNVQRLTASGRLNESKIFLARVSTDSSGVPTVNDPVPLNADTTSDKGRPAILETGSGAIVFYPASSGGKKSINYARYIGTFGPASPLDFGSAFDSVDSPSAVGRVYSGKYPANYGGTTTNLPAIIDLTFSGRLKGRANGEIYLGQLLAARASGPGATDRLPEDANGNLLGSPWVWQNQQVERLVAEASGSYRARGVVWNPAARIQLFVSRPGVADTSILLDGYNSFGVYNAANDTRRVDRETGLISVSSSLGGKVYIDPQLGTVRFGSSIIDKTATLRISYQPMFIRISTGNVGTLSQPSGLYDGRHISNTSFWRSNNNGAINPAADIHNDRFVFTYNRSAVGSGQGARPLMSTMRFGIRLPSRIFVNNGNVPLIQVTGAIGPYQVDPANGRVYFTAADEDNDLISITYTGVNDSTGAPVNGIVVNGVVVALVLEQAEQLIPIEGAANETGLTAFLDPFSYLNQRRPPLMWLFWSSTRTGVPDLYFQTLAPQFAPVAVSK